MTQEHASINGALLRLRREARGWLQSDVATRACMSIKQIRQLEDGGLSAFYSEAVKVTAAKKVGGLLGLTEDEVFSHGQPEVVRTDSSISPEADLAALLASTHEADHDDVHAMHDTHPHEAHLASSPALSEPADEVPSHHAEDTFTPPAYKAPSEPAESEGAEALSEQAAANNPAKSKTSLVLIAALFVGAIVLAAVFRPEQEVAPTEPPPPLQPALQTEPAAEAGKEGAIPADGAAATAANPAAPGATSAAPAAPVAAPAAPPAAPTPSAATTSPSPASPAPQAAPAAAPKTN